MKITLKAWKIMQKQQKELDQAIYAQKPKSINWEWISLTNAKRLKLNILVEIGELANELRSFKIWRNKKKMDLTKVKEELIDCLCFFLGLCNLYQINNPVVKEITAIENKSTLKYNENDLDINETQAAVLNDLLLKIFFSTVKLTILENEMAYNSKKEIKLSDTEKATYSHWLQIFGEIAQYLVIDEKELLKIYTKKWDKNQQRVKRGR